MGLRGGVGSFGGLGSALDIVLVLLILLVWSVLIHLVRRRRRLGPVLMRSGTTRPNHFFLAIGCFWVLLALLEVFSRIGRWDGLPGAIADLSMGVLFLYGGLAPIEVRTGGVAAFGFNVLPWGRLEAFSRNALDPRRIRLHLKAGPYLGRMMIDWRLPEDSRDTLAEVLADHLPERRAEVGA